MKALLDPLNMGTVKVCEVSLTALAWARSMQHPPRLHRGQPGLGGEDPLPIFVSGKLEEINSLASVMSQCYGCYGLLWVGQSTALLLTDLAEMPK